MDTGHLQRILDELYLKQSRGRENSVLSLFANNHLNVTGINGTNNWRNNVNFQKGFSCYAPADELLRPDFRNAPRLACPHLDPLAPISLKGATCALKPGALYRNEDHPKAIRLDPLDGTVTIYNPADVNFYGPIVSPGGKRIPIGPLIVALYHNLAVAGSRTEVDVSDFLTDFNFTDIEFNSYFDLSQRPHEHIALATEFPGQLSWNPTISAPSVVGAGAAALGAIPTPAVPGVRRRTRPPLPTGASVTTVAPPAGSNWWDAEQAVRQAMLMDGWAVTPVGHLGLGYDHIAKKGGITRYVEVKSSAGSCVPSLTENEYSEACRLRRDYVLAVVENFDPTAPASIRWVQDPAHLRPTKRAISDVLAASI